MVTRKLAWFPLLDSINSGLIQTFFAYRAYLLCGRKIVIPVIIGVSLCPAHLSQTTDAIRLRPSSSPPSALLWQYGSSSPA
jgi:hypothetical protein